MKQPLVSGNGDAQLLAIVEVEHDQRVRCGNPGCGHSVHKAIHVVQQGAELLVLGSTCFGKRYGRGALGTPRYGGGGGRKLTTEERELLLTNTSALLELFKDEQEAQRRKLSDLRAAFESRAVAQQRTVPSSPTSPSRVLQPWGRENVSVGRVAAKQTAPWPWMKPMTSMAGFRMRDGSAWVRVQHSDGRQMLAPWPAFDGWDEWLPAHFGHPCPEFGAYQVHDIQVLISYLRTHKTGEKVSGLWSEIAAVLAGA